MRMRCQRRRPGIGPITWEVRTRQWLLKAIRDYIKLCGRFRCRPSMWLINYLLGHTTLMKFDWKRRWQHVKPPHELVWKGWA